MHQKIRILSAFTVAFFAFLFLFQNCSNIKMDSALFETSLQSNASSSDSDSTTLRIALNVKDFGAKGDGEIDDTAAVIQAVEAARVAGGGIIYFPRGYYNISRTVKLSSNTVLQGESSTFAGYSQIRFVVASGQTSQNQALFLIEGGTSAVEFRDLEIRSMTSGIITTRTDVNVIKAENTAAIRLLGNQLPIKNVIVENVRLAFFTHGFEARGSDQFPDPLIQDIKIRGMASMVNQNAMYVNSMNATDWDVQNLNVVEMYQDQNGLQLIRAGKMQFLQLSCASTGFAGDTCVTIEKHNGLYFSQAHIEGARQGYYIKPNTTTAPIVFENTANVGEIHGKATIYYIGNRATEIEDQYRRITKFEGLGRQSTVYVCGDTYLRYDDQIFLTHAEMDRPGLAGITPQPCPANIVSMKVHFAEGTMKSRPDLAYSGNVKSFGARGDGIADDTQAIQRALQRGGVFFPAGTYHVSSTLLVPPGTIVQGEAGAVVVFSGKNQPLFRTLVKLLEMNTGTVIRDLALRANSQEGTTGIEIAGYRGGGGDMQFNNLSISQFHTGLWVRPTELGNMNEQPQVDSVSAKNILFSGNVIGLHVNDDNASNWNIENTKITGIKPGFTGIRLDRGGHMYFRNTHCIGDNSTTPDIIPAAQDCFQVVRHNGLFISGLKTDGMQTAVRATWESGHSPFPWVMRESDVSAGFYLEGRAMLTSLGNKYGAVTITSGHDILGGHLSRIFSCGDQFSGPPFPGLAATHYNYLTQAQTVNLTQCK